MRPEIILAAVMIAVAVSGCTTTDSESYGNETVIEYSDVSQEKIESIHSGLVDIGWDSNNANVTQENETWYTVNLQTDIKEQELNATQQYRFQQTATMLDYQAFNENETLQLKAYNTDSELISLFTQ